MIFDFFTLFIGFWNDRLSTIAVLSEKCCKYFMIHNHQPLKLSLAVTTAIYVLDLRHGKM